MKKCLAVLIAFLAACEELPHQPRANDSGTCRHLDLDLASSNGVADPAIIDGLLISADSAYEFRPCGKVEIYVVDGSLAILDELDQYFSTRAIDTALPAYVRFHGLEIECNDNLPDRDANVVEITELIAIGTSLADNCD